MKTISSNRRFNAFTEEVRWNRLRWPRHGNKQHHPDISLLSDHGISVQPQRATLTRLFLWICECIVVMLAPRRPRDPSSLQRGREVKCLERKQAEPRTDLTVSREDVPRSRVSLCGLPNELLVMVMSHLPRQSLWCLRQTSTVFLSAFEARPFQHLHGELGLRDRYVPFSMKRVTRAERAKMANFIQTDRDSIALGHESETETETEHESDSESPQAWTATPEYCSPCVDVQNHGGRDPNLISLRKTYFCDGCKERHAGIFFPPESIEMHDHGGGAQLICFGRTGRVTLCSHNPQHTVTWQAIEQRIPSCGDSYRVACTHRSHEPRPERLVWETSGSSFPRLLLARDPKSSKIHLTLGWDLPMLDIDPKNTPSTAAIRRTLATLLDNALGNHKLCRHMTDGRRPQFRAFAYSGICRCFKPPNQNTTS